MTLQDCISRVDSQMPNQYTVEEKIDWLSRLDATIRKDVIDKYKTFEARQCVKPIEFKPYTIDSMTEELIAPFPYDELYVSYVKAKIHELNEETYRYNNAVTLFNEQMENFAREYNRTHFRKCDPQFRLW